MGSYLAATDTNMQNSLDGVILESSFTRYRTITKDVADEELDVSRSKQKNMRGWQRPVKNKDNT
mgnify:CR=1 FL=1